MICHIELLPKFFTPPGRFKIKGRSRDRMAPSFGTVIYHCHLASPSISGFNIIVFYGIEEAA